MKKYLTILLLFAVIPAFAQKPDFRRGNREFRKGEYGQADISYRKGLLKDSTSVAARYNLANNLYRQQNYDEAARQLDMTPADSVLTYPFAADYFFNRGDVAIAQQDWQKAVDSFIQCLKLTPDDIAAKENYTYARKKLEEQQNQNQNQDQNQDGGGQGDNNQDQQDQNQDQNKDQDQNQDQGQKPQPQEAEITPQQAQQMLQAIQEKERQTQEKVDKEKAAAVKSRQKEKNW